MIAIISGVITALAVIIISIILFKNISTKIVAANVLFSIAFIYVGFALIQNEIFNILVEVVVALLFYFIAAIGYAKHNFIIGFGIILHGLWDSFHHWIPFVSTDIPKYWASYCFTTDLILGIYFLFYTKLNAIEIKMELK